MKQAHNFIQNKISQGVFTAASVTFGRAGKKPLSIHAGQLSRKIQAEVNEHTVFDLQSMTKALVTAPLFLNLQREGRLDLTTEAAQVLEISHPMLDNSAANAQLKHLLTHSAGFSDQDMTGDFETAYHLWHRIFTAPRHYERGTSVEYADASFRVLGKALECVLGETLDSASRRILFQGERRRDLGFLPLDPFNVAGCKDAHGTIDDEHVRQLGGIVGCDGLFGSSEAIFELISSYMIGHSALAEPLAATLKRNTFAPQANIGSYFDSLSKGPKTLGWEINPPKFSYAGKYRTDSTFEKSGGAGTFIWFDDQTQLIFVYLTNYGKPKPFNPKNWNRLVEDLEPQVLSELLIEQPA